MTLLDRILKLTNGDYSAQVRSFEGLETGLSINKGATEEELKERFDQVEFTFPSEYLDLLKQFDGGVFFSFENFGGLHIFSSKEIAGKNLFLKNNYNTFWLPSILVIGEFIGDGDYLGLKFISDQDYQVLDCFGEENPINWKPICNSIDFFLLQFIDEGGKKFWL